MKALILCSNISEELGHIFENKTGCMIRMAGKPVLEYILEQLRKIDVSDVILSLEKSNDEIVEYVENYCDEKLKLHFNVSGTKHIELIKKMINTDNDDLIILNDDTIFDFSLSEMLKKHKAAKTACTIAVKSSNLTHLKYAAITDNKGLVTEIRSADSVLNSSVARCLTEIIIVSEQRVKELDFTCDCSNCESILHNLSSMGQLSAYEDTGLYEKIISVENYINCQLHILYRDDKSIVSATDSNFCGATIIPPCYIGSDVFIEAGAVVKKGSVIDNNAVVSARAVVSGSYVGANSRIGECCRIEKTLLCENSRIGESVKCGDFSAVGENSSIGENSILCSGVKVYSNKNTAHSLHIHCDIVDNYSRNFLIDEDGTCSVSRNEANPVIYSKFGLAVGSAFSTGSIIVTGRGLETHTKILANSFADGLAASGMRVYDIGVCTQAQLMFCINRLSGVLGCYVGTDINDSIRLFGKCGLPVNLQLQKNIEKNFNYEKFRLASPTQIEAITEISGESEIYLDFVKNNTSSSLRNVNINVATNDKLIALLADKIFLNRNDTDGKSITFHISQNPSGLTAYSDDTGFLSWEKLCALGCRIAFEQKRAVSIPYCFPSTADILAEYKGGMLYRYLPLPASNDDSNARAIAERVDNLFVRDGLLLSVIIASYLSENGLTLKEAMSDIPDIYTTQRYICCECGTMGILADNKCDGINDEKGIELSNEGVRAIIRPLRKGNGLMIFAESKSCEAASAFCDDINERIKKYESGIKD